MGRESRSGSVVSSSDSEVTTLPYTGPSGPFTTTSKRVETYLCEVEPETPRLRPRGRRW